MSWNGGRCIQCAKHYRSEAGINKNSQIKPPATKRPRIKQTFRYAYCMEWLVICKSTFRIYYVFCIVCSTDISIAHGGKVTLYYETCEVITNYCKRLLTITCFQLSKVIRSLLCDFCNSYCSYTDCTKVIYLVCRSLTWRYKVISQWLIKCWLLAPVWWMPNILPLQLLKTRSVNWQQIGSSCWPKLEIVKIILTFLFSDRR